MQKRISSLFILTLLLMSFFHILPMPTVKAATYPVVYVWKDAPGGWFNDTQKATILDGLAACQAGGTLYIWAGDYSNENIENATGGQGRKVIGNGSNLVKISDSWAGALRLSGNTYDWNISGVTFETTKAEAINLTNCNNITIHNCTINATHDTNLFNSVIDAYASDTDCRDIYIHHNTIRVKTPAPDTYTAVDCIEAGDSGGAGNVCNWTIRDNTFVSYQGGSAGWGVVMYFDRTDNVTIINNTLTAEGAYGYPQDFIATANTNVDFVIGENDDTGGSCDIDITSNDIDFEIYENDLRICKLGEDFNVYDNTFSYIYYNGGGIDIDNCRITNNTAGYIALGTSGSSTVSDTIIENNTLTPGSTVDGIFLIGDDNTVRNNTMNGTGSGSTVGIYIVGSNNLIYNNKVTNCSYPFQEVSGTGNRWNTTKTRGTNILGGHYLAGNYWDDYTSTSVAIDGIGTTAHSYYNVGFDYQPIVYVPWVLATSVTSNSPHRYINYNQTFNATIKFPEDNPSWIKLQVEEAGAIRNYTMSWVSRSNLTGAYYQVNASLLLGLYKYRIIAKYNPTGASGWAYHSVKLPYFNINVPTYLEVGDYVEATGTISNETDIPISGIWINSTLLNSTNATVPLSNMELYVVNGYYHYIFSTSTIVPGIYYTYINFTQGADFYEGKWTIYLSVSGGPGYAVTDAHFAFYNNITGLGLDQNLFKLWVGTSASLTSDDRIYGTTYYNTYISQTLYYRVYDFFDIQVYPATASATFNVTERDHTVNIPIDWYDLAVKNLNETIIHFSLRNDTRYYNVTLFPMDTYHFYVLPGEYNITKTYYDSKNGTTLRTVQENITITADRFYIATGYDAHLYISLYNTNEGLGIPWDSLKFYVNGARLTEDRWYHGYINQSINITVKDYYNQTMYWGNHSLNSTYTFLDFGLTFHSYKFGNLNNEYYMISFLRDGGSRWFERGIMPYGELEFLLPSGSYQLRIYDADGVNLYTNSSVSMVNSRLYVLNGSHLTLVINGQSVITGHLLEILDEVTPSIIEVGYNIPFIRLCYNRKSPINNLIGANITLVCPPQILEGTTYNNTFTNRSIRPCIPTNASVNGTITVPDIDRLWFHGNTADWVNVTYTNGAVIRNFSYVPTFVDLNGAPIVWVNSSHNLSITRETRYHQVQEFDYTLYTDLSRYQATVNFTNPLNKVVEEVSLYISFADDDTTPDYGGVVVYDVTNSMTLTEGEHYDTSAQGIEMGIGSLTADESRQFRVTYYVAEENIQPKEAIVVLDDYGQMKPHEGENYYYLEAQWINRESESFIGPIYIQFNFTMPHIVSRESIDVWDDHNRRYLDRDEFAFTESGIIVTQDVVGRVSPQGARTYEIYYLHTAETTIENVVFSFLDAPVANVPGMGQFLGIHLVITILLLIGITAIFSGKTYRDHLWVFASCMLFIFLVTMAWLSPA